MPQAESKDAARAMLTITIAILDLDFISEQDNIAPESYIKVEQIAIRGR